MHFFPMLTSTFSLNRASQFLHIRYQFISNSGKVRIRVRRGMIRWTSCSFHQILRPFQYICVACLLVDFQLCQNLITLQNDHFCTFLISCACL
jgi:hypothetical protein